MSELKKYVYDENNRLDYELVGDYYISTLKASQENCPIGRRGQLHKHYLEETNLALY